MPEGRERDVEQAPPPDGARGAEPLPLGGAAQTTKAPRAHDARRERLTERRLDAILAKEADPSLRVLWLLLAATGARPSEARTLLWAEIGEREDSLWIRKTASKTKEGKKSIPVPPAVAEALRSMRKAGLFVFPSPRTGRAYDEATIRSYWADATARAELPENINLYQLRHLFGTISARRHKDHVLKRLMRHTDVLTTKQYYVEEDDEELRKAVDG